MGKHLIKASGWCQVPHKTGALYDLHVNQTIPQNPPPSPICCGSRETGKRSILPNLDAQDPNSGHTHHLVCGEVDVPRENEKVTTGEGSEFGLRLRLKGARDSIPANHVIGHLGVEGTDPALVTGGADKSQGGDEDGTFSAT